LFERFSEPTRQVVVIASDEARALSHDYIGTEHLLLGLLREPGGRAQAILRSLVTDMAGGVRPSSDVVGPPGPEAIGEVEVDLGWRGRSIALAALGEAVVGRCAFDPRRTGDLSPIEIQLLAYLELGARDGATVESVEKIDSLVIVLACDLDDVRVAVISLMRAGLLAAPMGDDDDRVVITPEGTVRVQEWLRRTVSLFGGWPPTVPGVDDV
jgi:Clp amino terminal domain, pathogenicity island component